MNSNIKLEGMDELKAKFEKIAGGAGSGLQQGLLKGGEIVRAEAVANCPVDTGRLRQSIVVEQTDGASVTVGTNLEYAPYVEFGTGLKGNPTVAHTTKNSWVYFSPKLGHFVTTHGQTPQPFLVPALHSQKEAVIEAIKDELLKSS